MQAVIDLLETAILPLEIPIRHTNTPGNTAPATGYSAGCTSSLGYTKLGSQSKEAPRFDACTSTGFYLRK